MKEFFIITTNNSTAKAIEMQCNQTNNHTHRSFELGKVTHEQGYSEVQIVAKTDAGISHEDIFHLGFMVGAQELMGANLVIKQEGKVINKN